MEKMIDTHCHLNDKYFYNNKELLNQVISNMSDDGLQQAYVVGCDYESSVNAIKLAERHENLFAIIGMHPHDSKDWNNEFEEMLKKYSTHKKVIAIGEMGLDYFYDLSDRQVQKQVFIKQLELANQFNLPVVIHNRDSIGDMIEILSNHKHLLNNGGVIHCFNESYESYCILKEMGFKFSFGGAITFKNAKNSVELLRKVDLNDVLLETDCPYLTPEPFRGREKNQPKYVGLVADKIADIKNIDISVVIKHANKNTFEVFKKAKR